MFFIASVSTERSFLVRPQKYITLPAEINVRIILKQLINQEGRRKACTVTGIIEAITPIPIHLKNIFSIYATTGKVGIKRLTITNLANQAKIVSSKEITNTEFGPECKNFKAL